MTVNLETMQGIEAQLCGRSDDEFDPSMCPIVFSITTRRSSASVFREGHTESNWAGSR